MKISIPHLLVCLAHAACIAAQEAYLYTHDNVARSHDSPPTRISPDVALAIFARRSQLTGDRWIHGVSDTVFEQLNQFGGWQNPMLGYSDSQVPSSRLSIILEGYNGDSSRLHETPDLLVEEPSTAFVESLSINSATSKGLLPGSLCNITTISTDGIRSIFEYNTKGNCDIEEADIGRFKDCLGYASIPEALDIVASRFLPAVEVPLMAATWRLDLSKISGADSKISKVTAVASIISDINTQLSRLATSHNLESALFLLPTRTNLQPSNPQEIPHHLRRQTLDEEPLSTSSSSLSSDPADSPTPQKSNTTAPKLGPGIYLPTCFSDADACRNSTNSCSGHGVCRLKHAGCYACRCTSTIIRKYDDGSTKSVQWGGLACEKKDVSVPFFLFAGFGVAMAALVAGGIGLLYNMGAEELPSVIGAGVAGPRATK